MIPDALKTEVEVCHLPPAQLVAHLANSGSQSIYVDGGKTIQAFLVEGLIEEMTISVIPVLIGRGIPLFGALPQDIHLELVSAHAFASGLLQSKYRVIKDKIHIN
jgi:dihydrofolate reductase